MSKALDLTNQRFGALVALERAPKRNDKYTRWICLCDCGKTTEVRTDYLRNGHTTSCGCACGRIDYTNKRFGRLVALEHLPGGKYKCQCNCGNTTIVATYNLVNGNTQSCGCLQKEKTSEMSFISLVGQKFGKLTVLERVENNRFNHVCWKCQCECGSITIVDGTNLKNGNTTSCGCVKSKGESKINILLQQHNINFIAQYSIDEIILSSGRRPFFDFAIFDGNNNLQYLIEYDGKQHFESGQGWNNEENFKITQNRDKQKNDWCKKLNIPLIRIPYWHLQDLCIEDLLLETSEYII